MSCGGGNVGVGVPGPQGPPGPTGPTGPGGGGGGGGNNVSIIGNVSGAPALISSGTLFLAGGNNVTLSQNGNSVTISANTAVAANLSISAGSTSGPFGGLTFSNGSNVSFGLNNGTITASVLAQSTQTQPAGNIAGIGTTFGGTNVSGSMTLNSNGLNLALSASGGIDASIAGNVAGAPVIISTGTLVLAGGNNVTLSQNGNSITISGANAGGAQTGISGLQVSNTTYTSGTVSLVNANGLTFGSSGANGISASYNSTQFAGTGTTFAGTNISASITHNSLGINLALSGAAGGSGASTVGIYAAGNTTAQSSSSTGAQSSLNLSFAGIVSGGWSSNTFVISAPGTTGLTQLSAGMSTGGNTAGITGLASAQLVLAGGANITLSGSTNAGSMTISIAGGAGGGGGGVGFGVSTGGNTAGATGTVTTGNVVLVGSGPISLSQATGGAGSAATITINAPATSSLVGTNGISISTNGSTISVSQISPDVFVNGNTTGQSSSSSYNPQSFFLSGAGNLSIGWSNSTLIMSAGTVAGAPVNFSAGTTSGNLGSVVFSNSNGVSFGLSGSTITASAAGGGGVQLSAVRALPFDVSTSTAIGQNVLQVYPFFNPVPFSASVANAHITNFASSSSNSSYAGAISWYVGLYTRNNSTLSLASSGSQVHQWTDTGGASYSLITGQRPITAPINVNYTGGDLWVAFMSATSFTNTNWFTASNFAVQDQLTAQELPIIGSSSNSTIGLMKGQGVFSTTTGALPNSMAFSQIYGLGAVTGGAEPGASGYLVPIKFANF